ncbi:hypothetical protein PFAG_03704 [Plasmodium falciparum Santa Lucia]|uniref:Uncharacterized protein n=2 Tax=Plasmodium falciparum TaxID=5833 RepID=W7FFS9_PLAFA|nr:hypothetical protein PFNF135_03869 [Plasmodium falciparum NF135/5.C10]EUT82955.1 hypothetical protein PFAG_03704 [Plasmodium falciparum Santa Lucia]
MKEQVENGILFFIYVKFQKKNKYNLKQRKIKKITTPRNIKWQRIIKYYIMLIYQVQFYNNNISININKSMFFLFLNMGKIFIYVKS